MIEPKAFVEEALPCRSPVDPECPCKLRPAVEKAMRRYAAAVLREAARSIERSTEGDGAVSAWPTSKEHARGLRALAAQLEEDR